MEFFRIHRDIPFMKHTLILNALSFLTSTAAVFFLFHKGLHPSVEFTGGTVMGVAYTQAVDLPKIRGDVEKLGYVDAQVQNSGTSRDVMIRLPLKTGPDDKPIASAVQSQQVIAALNAVNLDAKLQRVEFVDPQVGKELATDGLLALLFVMVGIVICLSVRFKWKLAVAGVITNLHDVVIILGFFVFFQWEFSLSVLAGVLAVLSYSVNEPVVIFDRIREAFHKYRKMNTHEMIDHVITNTIPRTIIAYGSTEVMVVSILVFGDPTLHYFAVALTIGILFGIYSSVFMAAALRMWLGVKREDLVKAGKKTGGPREDDPNFGAQV